MLKFICPDCKQECNVELLTRNVTCSHEIDVSSSEGFAHFQPVIEDEDDAINEVYRCSKCGWVLPVEPDQVGDDNLRDWLKEQEYNKGK